MKIQSLAIAILSTSVLLFHSCFTGVESTPKITTKELKKQNVVDLPEMHFLSSIKPQKPSEWRQGKKFNVLDDRISALFQPGKGEVHLAKGDIIEFIEAKPAMTFTGQDATDLSFKLPDGAERIYRVNLTSEDLKEKKLLEIPFALESSISDSLSKLMVGGNFYTLTSLWYDNNEEPVNGQKFIKVTIRDIVPGNQFYPVRVIFNDENSHWGSVFMSIGNEANSTRNFYKLFSFEDPHKSYPHISDENWELIKKAKVAVGMTRDECRLALGIPDEVSRRPSGLGLLEMWNYVSGKYLIFTDGLLSSFRI